MSVRWAAAAFGVGVRIYVIAHFVQFALNSPCSCCLPDQSLCRLSDTLPSIHSCVRTYTTNTHTTVINSMTIPIARTCWQNNPHAGGDGVSGGRAPPTTRPSPPMHEWTWKSNSAYVCARALVQ